MNGQRIVNISINVIVPEWAKWLAIDQDGGIWTYSRKPVRSARSWELPRSKSEGGEYIGKYDKVGDATEEYGIEYPDWDKSLIRI